MSDCRECQLVDRRDFLQQVALAFALTVRFGHAAWSRDEEHAYPIPDADGATIDKENQIILVRSQGKVYGFNLACPHQNTALHWLADEDIFQCPKHKSRYQPDGTFISGRATRNMDRFAIRRDGNTVVVDVDKMYKSDEDKTDWDAAVVTL